MDGPLILALRSSLLALLLALPTRAEEDLDRKALESEAWRKGDYVGLLDEWVGVMKEHPDAPQVEVMLRAWKNVEVFIPDPTAFLPKLRALDGALEGPNAFHLRRNVARLLVETGNSVESRSVTERDGDLRRWRIAGPFGRTASACFETVYPPERGAGCEWRAYPGRTPVRPGLYLRPFRGAAYAMCQVRAEEDADASLWIESAGPARVWWNAGPLPDLDRLRAFSPRTLVAPVRLAKGWNRVLVKTLVIGEGFRVRILGAQGDPVRLAEEEGDEVHPCGPPSPGATWSAWGALARYEAAKEESGWAAAMRAFLLSEEEVPDRALTAGLASVERLPTSAHLVCLLGELWDSADHLPESERRNRAKDCYEKALSIDPSFVPALEDLAIYYKRDHKAEKALAALARAGEIHPSHFAGPFLSAQVFQEEGWASEARHALDELDRRAAGTVAVVEGRAFEAVALGDYAGAKKAYDAIAARSATARRERAALLRATGDLEAAIGEARRDVDDDPSDPRAHAALADVLADAGKADDAVEAFRRAAALVPKDPSYPRRIGEVLLRAGRTEEAIASLREARAIDPSDDGARDLLAELEAEPEEVPEAYRIDADQVLKDAPPPIGAPVDHLIVQRVLRFHEDGSATLWTHRVVRLDTQEAVDSFGEVQMEGAVLEARNVRPDGKVLFPSQIGEGGTITMPGVVVGSVIETRFRREVAPQAEGLSTAFFFHDRQRNGPVARVRFVVEWPDALAIDVQERRLGMEVERIEPKTAKGWKAAAWDARDLPMLERQSHMPADEDLLPYVLVAERRTWAEVAEGLREVVLGKGLVTEEVRRVAAEQLKGRTGDREKAEAAYRFAQSWVKDTSGAGDAQTVLSTRSGSILTLASAVLDADGTLAGRTRSGSILTLASAVLDAMGVAHEWVAARPREEVLGEAVWDVPRGDVFTSAGVTPLLRVPLDGGALWLAGDARFLGPGQIPELAQGGDGLVLEPGAPRFVTVPTAPPEAAGNTVAIDAALDADGTLAGRTRLDLRGVAAAGYKDRLLGVEGPQRKMIFQALLANYFLGFQLEEMELPGLDEPGTPLSVVATFKTPSFARLAGDRMSVPAPIPPSRLRKNYCRERERTVPLRMATWEVSRTEAVIRLPEGWRVSKLPEDVFLQGGVGRLSITWRLEGDAVRVRHEIEMRPQVLAPGRYPELVEFCLEGDAAEDQRMELVKP